MEKNELKGKTILVVHAGSIKKRFIFQRLKKLGMTVVCLNKDKNPLMVPYVDHWILADLNNYKECVQGIKHFITAHPTSGIDGVFTFWEESVLLTAKIVDLFGFIGTPFAIANIARNKYLFREFCEKQGLPAPRHQVVRSKQDIKKLRKDLRYPLVIKPQHGSMSTCVVRVENATELAEAYDFVKSNIKSYEYYSPEWDTLEVFVEEYIDGDEVDVDVLLQNGKIKFYCISDNYNKSRDRFFVDSGQAIPSGLPEKERRDLITMTEEILEKLGVTDACVHFEAKSTKNGPVPLEINLRLGGDYIPSYIKGAWGIDLVDYIAKIALGIHFKIEKKQTPLKYIIGWDLYPDYSGILVELNVNEELEKKKYLEEIHIYKETGDAVLLPPEGNEGLGWLTVSGDNLLDAQDNLKEALKFITYKVVGFDTESTLGKTARKDRFSAAVMKKNLLLKASKLEKVRQVNVENQRNLRIGIAGNIHDVPGSKNVPHGVLDIVSELDLMGYQTTFFDFNNLNRAIGELKRSSVDLIINAAEGINNDPKLRSQVIALLEAMHLPFTGSSSFNTALSGDKIRTKKLLTYHNIPTPAWDYAYKLEDTIDENLRYPLIVKPGTTDNSSGITNNSVVKNKQELERELKRIIVDIGQPALVEEYIEGDEYYVSILGSTPEDFKVLPLSRSIFKKLPPKYWHIYSEEAKEQTNPIYKKIIVERPVKNISAKLESLLTEIALDTYQILRCRDYGSVEIRVDKDDNPYVLELNPNPVLHTQSAIAKSAKLVGLNYGELLEEVINLSIKRLKKKTMYPKFLE